jgi:hypothetical protein
MQIREMMRAAPVPDDMPKWMMGVVCSLGGRGKIVCDGGSAKCCYGKADVTRLEKAPR